MFDPISELAQYKLLDSEWDSVRKIRNFLETEETVIEVRTGSTFVTLIARYMCFKLLAIRCR